VDDDGFVTVVSAKRKKPLPEEFTQPVKKQKSKEMDNFYRFQTREKKRGRTYWLLLYPSHHLCWY
jgi:ribosomal RNA-processing protein 7